MKLCTAAGVAAEWGVVCELFLRRVDVANHDIACSRDEVSCMVAPLEAVFLKGSVFRDILAGAAATVSASASAEEPLPQIAASASGELVQPGFTTSVVVKSLWKQNAFLRGRHACPLVGGSRCSGR